jgi:hypothetical protein
MAQLVVRNIEEYVKMRLKRRAATTGSQSTLMAYPPHRRCPPSP